MTDLLVVGAGVAGLSAAIAAADAGLDVVVVYKPARGAGPSTSTAYAQGGIAVVDLADRDDGVQAHVADTVTAGGPLVDIEAARSILGDGPAAVQRLIEWGARFDRDSAGRLQRTREGGHSVSRIIHAGGDATGAEVQRALLAAARMRANLTAVAAHVHGLLGRGGRIVGVRTDTGDLRARTVVLATGGAGHVFASTTNPVAATGDGIALAVAAGAQVRELDYVQFHPTMLYTPGARGRRPLLSEALRGEGAHLVDVIGGGVMDGIHPRGDLAPRDVVARAVIAAMSRTNSPYVLLDARAIPAVSQRFPTVAAAVRRVGLDLQCDLIPVVPGAHYLCGGVVTDLRGATGVPGLFAAGEIARTGLHGANRLASNSLLEAMVMGLRVATEAASATAVVAGQPDEIVTAGSVRGDRQSIQDAMSRQCGVTRSVEGLTELVAQLAEPAPAPRTPAVSSQDHEDRALTAVARLMAIEALQRIDDRSEGVA